MQIGVLQAASPPACRVPALDRQYMQNIQIVASDRGPCTLRLRRNYGLRSPGIPLPPHRLPRSAAPSGAPDRERALICNDAPGAARTRHDRFRRRSNDDDAGAQAVGRSGGCGDARTSDGRCGLGRLRPAVALAAGLPAGGDAGHGQHRLVPRLPALADHRDHAVRAGAAGHRHGRFNAKANPMPSRTTHNTLLEVVWTVVPVLILVVIAVPSFRLLFLQLTIPPADVTVKATGKQWYWSYSYPGRQVRVRLADAARTTSASPTSRACSRSTTRWWCRSTRSIRVQVIGADVIHAFAVPSFGIKIDAIPGRLNETWFKADARGHLLRPVLANCAARTTPIMPIAVRVVSDQDYAAWLEQAKKKYATDDSRAGDRTSVAAEVGASRTRTDQRAITTRSKELTMATHGSRRTRRPRRHTSITTRPAGGASSIRPTTRTSARCTWCSRSSPA